MTFFKSSLKLTLLSLLTFGIAVPVFAIPDFDNGIRFAINRGILNSGTGFLQYKGDVTATDDLEDVSFVTLTGRSNLQIRLEGIAPNGGRTDLLLVRDANKNGKIDSGETISQSKGSFSHILNPRNVNPGQLHIIVRSKEFNSKTVRYQVSVDSRV